MNKGYTDAKDGQEDGDITMARSLNIKNMSKFFLGRSKITLQEGRM